MLNPKTETKVLKLLKRNKEGLTVIDISRKLGIHRTTASKYMWYLYGTQDISLTTFGKSEVFKLVKRP